MKKITLNLICTLIAAFITVDGFADDARSVFTEPGQSLWLNGNGYVNAAPLLGGRSQATLMGWFKADATLNATSFLIGQDNINIRLISNGILNRCVASANGQTIESGTVIIPGRWYHLAVSYDAGADEKLVLYLNGRKEAASNAQALAGALSTSDAPFTMGKNPSVSSEFFKGGIDEVRVFSVALQADAIRKMIFQEIAANGTKIRGEVIPRDIAQLDWSTLLAYFRMDANGAVLIDRAPAQNPIAAQVYNAAFTTAQPPMPFVTTQSGVFEEAIPLQEFSGTIADYPWAIAHIQHNVDIDANRTLLGMIVDANATVTLGNDNKLQNTWYLKLDGQLDLRGKSQLVQTVDSQLDATSSGLLRKTQQGQSNRYNYNYWCSPVGTVNDTANNAGYTVNNVLRDATDIENLQPITWTTSLDGQPTTPVTLSGYWIFKFQNMSPSYANWSSVGPNGLLLAGQGFTLKGSSSESGVQDLAFIGKPNNGTITTTIAPGNLNLTGNPYPSAIDANQFIMDNVGKINGTIYFWEHDAANNSHLLADYQGGYATRNLVGGTPTFSRRDPLDTAPTKVPGRFIPVGQGFFVRGNSQGGTVTFSNSQRAFMKEDAALSNPLFRQHTAMDEVSDNNNDEAAADTFARIRLGFEAPNQFHRQVLLGFMEEFANSGINPGYDAINIDTQPYDMYLMNAGQQLIISGEGYFNPAAVYPIGIKAAVESTVKLMLDGTENFDQSQPLYIYDALTQTYHDLRAGAFEVNVSAGTNTTRFTLRFHNPTLSATAFDAPNSLQVTFTTNDNTLVIENPTHARAKTVSLCNLIGQTVAEWPIAHLNQNKLEIPIQAHAGPYVIKVHTTNGDIAKKIIVK